MCAIDNADDSHAIFRDTVNGQPAFDDQHAGIAGNIRSPWPQTWEFAESFTPLFGVIKDAIGGLWARQRYELPDGENVLSRLPRISHSIELFCSAQLEARASLSLELLKIQFTGITALDTNAIGFLQPSEATSLDFRILLHQPQRFANHLAG